MELVIASETSKIKHGDLCYCFLGEANCDVPMSCDTYTDKCDGWASLGQVCRSTHCKDSYCDGKICVGKENFKVSDDITCLPIGHSCTTHRLCSYDNPMVKADDCCYPLSCKGGTCKGLSKEGQQCVTSKCIKGYTCNSLRVCEKCRTSFETCSYKNKCCDSEGLKCIPREGKVGSEMICRSCKVSGKACSLEDDDYCCNNDENCVLNHDEKSVNCINCSLTGGICKQDNDCCYNTDKCYRQDDKSLKCAKKGNVICADSSQNCRTNDPFTRIEVVVECCGNSTCLPMGVCQ